MAEQETVVKVFYEADGIQIFNGDCRDVVPFLDRRVLVVTDPPYGIGWDTDYAGSHKVRYSGRRCRWPKWTCTTSI